MFVINEGEMQKIWKVEFVGNEFLSERRLNTKVDSKPPMMKIFKGYVTAKRSRPTRTSSSRSTARSAIFDAKIGRE